MRKRMVLAALFAVFSIGTYAATVEDEQQPQQYTVHEGDTLWAISEQYAPDGADVRKYYYKIMTDNRLDRNGTIYPGQVITLYR